MYKYLVPGNAAGEELKYNRWEGICQTVLEGQIHRLLLVQGNPDWGI